MSSRSHNVGTLTDASIFSFHSAKLVSTLGEGGMVATNSKSLASSIRNLINYGGESNWGLNYRLSSIQAFAGSIQMQSFEKNLVQRKKIGQMV